MASRTQVPSVFLTVILNGIPHGVEAAATAPGKHPHTTSRSGKGDISSLCLFIGAKNPFPEAPRRLLTPHWPELVTCPCLSQKQEKGMEPHVCINGSGFTHICAGEQWAWKRHTAVGLKTNMFCPRYLP